MRLILRSGLLVLVAVLALSWGRLESQAGLPDPNLLRYPYLQQVMTTSATVVWTTHDGGPSEVRYGVADGAQSVAPATSDLFVEPVEGGRTYYVHVAQLSGLSPGTTYNYAALTNGIELATNDALSFRTDAGPGESMLSVLVLGDSGTGGFEQQRLRNAMAERDFDLAIHVGDVAYQDGTYQQLEDYFFSVYAGLASRVPFYLALGNHDYQTLDGQPYLDAFYLPENAGPSEQRERYYSFDFGPVHFATVDTEILAGFYGGPSAAQEMLDWLAADLLATSRPWVIVFFHRPPYSSSDVPVAPNLDAVVPVLEQYQVDLVLDGHDHIYARTVPIGGGMPQLIGDGIIYVTTGGGGGGKHLCEPRWFTATCLARFHFLDLRILDGCQLSFDAVTFGGGVIDHYDLNRCQPDTDNDGLPDADESQRGTDPLDPDTDGDTFSDGVEVDAGTDPLDPNSTPGPAPATPTPTPTPTRTATSTPTRSPTAERTPTHALLPGDANCDGSVSSIDAAFVLQRVAGLLAALPCAANADVNGDGAVDSRDAAIILQAVAGLIEL